MNDAYPGELKPAAFSSVGGRLCLDFANTTSVRRAEPSGERLNSFEDWVAWGAEIGLIGPREAAQLRAEAARAPEQAAEALAEAIRLRDAIYRIFSAEARGERARAEDLSILNESLVTGTASRRLRLADRGFCWLWDGDSASDLGWMRWPIAYSAAELLTSDDDLARVKECRSEACEWLFIDLSRNRSRCWCDMRDCGNRAKARRHYARRRKVIS